MKVSIIWGGLSVLSLLATPSFAQSEGREVADTLRRSLRVMTSEEAKLMSRVPLSIRLTPPQTAKTHLSQWQPSPLPKVEGLPKVEPLASLPPLPSLYEQVSQKGYLSGSLGLSYNAQFAGGYRAINTDKDLLDLNLDLFGTNYKHGIAWGDMTIKEFGLNVAGAYHRKLSKGELSIDAKYRYGRNNAYGTPYVQDEFIPIVQADLDLLGVSTAEMLPYHALDAGLDYRGRAEWNGLWEYKLIPQFTLTKRSGFTETGLSLGAGFSKNLGSDQTIGIEGRLLSLGYSGNKDLLTRLPLSYLPSGMVLPSVSPQADSKTIVELLPSWSIEGVGSSVSWSARAGLGVHLHTDRGHSGSFLTPQIEGMVRFARSWFARLALSGGIRQNSLSELVASQPQLHISSLPMLSKERISAELRLGGAIRPNLSVEAFVGYSRLDDLSNAEAQVETLSSSNGTLHALSYTFSALDAQRIKLGAELDYEAQDWFRLGVRAVYNHWSSVGTDQSVTARPTLELGASLGLRPLERLDLNFGYRLYSGVRAYINQRDYTTGSVLSSSQEVSVPVYHALSAQGIYRLSSKFSLSADGFFSPSRGGTLYWGYPVQRFGVNFGFAYVF